MLFPVAPEVLSKTLLPVGGMRKTEVRALAEKAGLPVFAKPDSVEICFVPSGDYRDLLRERGGLGKPGRVVDLDGNTLATHDGHMGFTRGQRRGLGFASTQPMYVLDIDIDRGDVLVGPRGATGCSAAVVRDFGTFGCTLTPGERLEDIVVQFRSSPGGQQGTAKVLNDGRIAVQFREPAQSVNPGQGLAIYRGQRLLGGGWIESVERSAALTV